MVQNDMFIITIARSSMQATITRFPNEIGLRVSL